MNSLVSTDQSDSGDLAFAAGASRLSVEDREALERAMRELESTSLAIRLSSILGRQAGAVAKIRDRDIYVREPDVPFRIVAAAKGEHL